MKDKIYQTSTTIKANGGCNHCNRSGFAFLPVRYAVAKHSLAKHIALPKERISAFTKIFLNKLVNDDGTTSTKISDAKYILRKLRDGYLYVYDEHPLHSHWLCYAVGNNGELTEFPAGKSAFSVKVECDNNINYALANLVTLQDKKTDRTINIIFVESPFSYKRLSWIAQHPDWRGKYMRQLQLSQIASSPFCFSKADIQKYVAEYSKLSPVSLLKDDLEPGRFISSAEYSFYSENGRDTYECLLQAFNKANDISGSGYAIAIPDSAGIIKQLGAYRLSAINEFNDKIKPGDKDSDKEFRKGATSTKNNMVSAPHYELNERNYKWYLAVNKLKDLMAASFDVKNKGYGELLPPGIPENIVLDNDDYYDLETKEYVFRGKTYREALNYYNNIDKKFQQRAEKIIKDNEIASESEKENIRLLGTRNAALEKNHASLVMAKYGIIWKSKQQESRNNIKKSEEEILKDYIEWDDWCAVRDKFENEYMYTKCTTISFDSDYVFWVQKELHDDLDKYDPEDPIQCGVVVNIIAEVLKDGIISGASKYLWRCILFDKNNLIDRGLSLNNTIIYDDIKKSIENFSKKDDKKKIITPTGELNKELIGKIEKNAAKIRDFLSKAKNLDWKGAFEIKEAPLVSTFKSLTTLHNTAINTTSSLVVDELKKQVGKDLIKQNTIAVGFRYSNRLVELHNFGNTINKAFYGNGFQSYVTIEVGMTVPQANSYIHSLNKYLEKDKANIRNKSVKLYDNGEKVGGNYHFDEASGSSNVTMYVFIRENATANEVNSLLSARGVDALGKDIKKMYQEQQKNLAKVNMPSAAVIKLGCIYSLISAIHAYSDKKDFSSMWKLISSILVVIQNASEASSWALTKQTEKLLEKSILVDSEALSKEIILKASKVTVASEIFMVSSKFAGHAVSLMAVYDAVKGLLETIDLYNSGALSEDYQNKAISTGVSFISSTVIGLFIKNVFITAIVAVAAIAILFFFDVNRIVPDCIQNWLRRSKFGKEGDTAPGRPFESIEMEQGGLLLLLKGIMFTASIESKDRVYRPKTSEEKVWYDYITGVFAISSPETLLLYNSYHPSILSQEIKEVKITFNLSKNFDGTLDVSGLNNNGLVYIYLTDENSRVCRLVVGKRKNNGGVSADTNVGLYKKIEHKRISYYDKYITIHDGIGLDYNFTLDEIVSLDLVEIKEDMVLSENVIFPLNEDNNHENIKIFFTVKSGEESIKSQYDIYLKLGSDRKN